MSDKVLQDMLQLLKESVSSQHAERLEQIVIALIGVEISKLFSAADISFELRILLTHAPTS
jgi:uncharacterized Rmd1/YagE family protein